MTRTLRTVLTAVLLLGLIAGGAGAAAADGTDNVVVINDDDVIDVDDSFNNITANVLGIQNDDSPLTIIF